MQRLVKLTVLVSAVLLAAGCDRPSSSETAAPAAPAAAVPSAKRAPAAPTADRSALGISYIETTTQGADPERELPLVIAIHGYGATPETLAPAFADLDVPVRIVLPRGTEKVEGAGFSWFRIGKRGSDMNVAGLDGAADKLGAAIAEIAKQRPTRGRPIVLGFSQGGMLTFAIALRFPELVAAAFPLSGWLPTELIPAKDPGKTYPKIMAMHGTADDVVLIGPTREAVAKMKERGFAVELLEYPDVKHQLTGPMRQRLYTLVGKAALVQAGK